MRTTDDDLIAEAIRDGRVRRLPAGARALPKCRQQTDEPRVHPESCGHGRQCHALPDADEQGE